MDNKAIVDKKITTFDNFGKQGLQGVLRLGVSIEELSVIFNEMNYIKSYVITYEKEPTPHLHFFLIRKDDGKKIYVNPTRNFIKKKIEILHKAPKMYKNGMLNLSPVKQPFKMLCYMYKEHNEDWFRAIPRNLDAEIVKLAKSISYAKAGGLMKEIKKVINQVKLKLMTPEEATCKYVTIRRRCDAPDPSFMKFYQKMRHHYMSEEELIQEVQERIAAFNQFY